MYEPQHSLLDVIDKVIETGVSARGEIVLGVAGLDLIYISLGLVISEYGKIQRATLDGATSRPLERAKNEEGEHDHQ